MKNKNLVMFVGKTHSGKTTVANEIKEKINDLLILEADPIAVLMKEQFPELRKNDNTEHSGAFNNTSLKYRTFLLFVEFALSLGKPIILSNSNMWLRGRAMVIDLCRKFNYHVIGVYFDFPEEVLMKRIQESKRSTNVLRISIDFPDLIKNQKSRMQVPSSSEFDEFITIKYEENSGEVKNKIIKVFS